jgi:hypothetical protein
LTRIAEAFSWSRQAQHLHARGAAAALLPAHHAGILSEQPLGEFERALTETASAHFVFTKHVAPVLNQSSSGSLIYISNGAGQPQILAFPLSFRAGGGSGVAAAAGYCQF